MQPRQRRLDTSSLSRTPSLSSTPSAASSSPRTLLVRLDRVPPPRCSTAPCTLLAPATETCSLLAAVSAARHKLLTALISSHDGSRDAEVPVRIDCARAVGCPACSPPLPPLPAACPPLAARAPLWRSCSLDVRVPACVVQSDVLRRRRRARSLRRSSHAHDARPTVGLVPPAGDAAPTNAALHAQVLRHRRERVSAYVAERRAPAALHAACPRSTRAAQVSALPGPLFLRLAASHDSAHAARPRLPPRAALARTTPTIAPSHASLDPPPRSRAPALAALASCAVPPHAADVPDRLRRRDPDRARPLPPVLARASPTHAPPACRLASASPPAAPINALDRRSPRA
ncbi:hypothetical protein B0H15DRAFT_982203 [Mycena belliarum]|uniref:Uncharacterized protein n=1 Tax=Mycena belliarum TaxID=1033014 RepID=A0AAD6XLZ4_9AGAR|nr:hypothetical protein B0H15DRAFT_982203 [Mycena belliae]